MDAELILKNEARHAARFLLLATSMKWLARLTDAMIMPVMVFLLLQKEIGHSSGTVAPTLSALVVLWGIVRLTAITDADYRYRTLKFLAAAWLTGGLVYWLHHH
jgi:hypothetical protein